MPFVCPSNPYSLVDCFVIFWHAGLLLLEWVDYSFGVWPALIFQTFQNNSRPHWCRMWYMAPFVIWQARDIQMSRHSLSSIFIFRCHTRKQEKWKKDFAKIVFTNFSLYLVELTVQLTSSITLKTLSTKTLLSSSVEVMMNISQLPLKWNLLEHFLTLMLRSSPCLHSSSLLSTIVCVRSWHCGGEDSED